MVKASMDKRHPLVGEEFFRRMMRLEEERKRHLVGGDRWSGAGDGSGSSNVVSLRDCRQQLNRRATKIKPE